ncbi:protein of unknown function [Paraburkholderia dioscoreae]|uniref:Uncharacterized protein n=1 Tax=Paraburkholderia dioscoreae TaxID=2604047 RepID=A0A5Q4Z6H4_9BURK|nr:protein of unknown function [Paraburkholderia dioscoreae]
MAACACTQRIQGKQKKECVAEELAQDTPQNKTENRGNTKEEGDEPDPRHWWKTAVAASFPT